MNELYVRILSMPDLSGVQIPTRMRSKQPINHSLINFFPIILLSFFTALSFFVLHAHSELSPEQKKERFQIAAVSQFLKNMDNRENLVKYILKAEKITPDDEATYLILGDSYFLQGLFLEAREPYLKAISINPKSIACMQLDRIKAFMGEKILTSNMRPEEIYRWQGIYFLDQEKNPREAIKNFTISMSLNPEQREVPAMRNIINQYVAQVGDPTKIRVLNTKINEIRLNYLIPTGIFLK